MHIDDEYIKKLFFSKTGKLNRSWQEKLCNDEVKNYLISRYSDSQSYKESIYRIYYNIENRPVCKICGASVKFIPDIKISNSFKTCRKGEYYTSACSVECSNRLRDQNKRISQLLMYGVDNVFKSPDIKKKIDETTIKHYGIKRVLCKGLVRDIIEANNKKVKGLNNIGYTPENIEKAQITNYLRRGVTNCMKDPEVINKLYNTQLRNGTFGKSKEEDTIYELIKKIYPSVKRQYTDSRYLTRCGNKAKCDFYIPELDMFIEYQGYFTHGDHPFDKDNEDDLNEMNNLFLKHKRNIIDTWIVSDVYKRQQAKNNNLNYVELFNMKEAKEFIEYLKKI